MTDRPESIIQAFLTWCEHDADRALLRWNGEWLSYGDIRNMASRIAGGLAELGIKPGDRVALFLASSPQFLAAYLGSHMAGALVVLVNTQYRQVELRHILSDSEAGLCITDAERRAELEHVRSDLPLLHTIVQSGGDAIDSLRYEELLQHGRPMLQPALPTVDDIALIAYTSGTTGRSKGAMLSHGNLASNSHAVTHAWGWTGADKLLLTLPLFHIHGLGVGIHGTLLSGASVDLRPHFDAAEVYTALWNDTPTMFFGVPTMYGRLIEYARAQAAAQEQTSDLPLRAGKLNIQASGVRLFVSGSAPLSPQTFAEFEALFGQAILERYGMTETVMNTTNPLIGERRPGTVGMPFPGQEARIVDARLRTPVADGEAGEIHVRGPHVFKGYWQRPDATTEAFDADGWFNTGDLGICSTDGYFTIVGRARELIISGGYNIYPREVEEVLAAYPGLSEVAVFGMPHPDMGEQVIATVVSTSGAHVSAEELISYCREQLASYKKPRKILFVEALPRNAMGKVQKHVLMDMLRQQTERPGD